MGEKIKINLQADNKLSRRRMLSEYRLLVVKSSVI